MGDIYRHVWIEGEEIIKKKIKNIKLFFILYIIIQNTRSLG